MSEQELKGHFTIPKHSDISHLEDLERECSKLTVVDYNRFVAHVEDAERPERTQDTRPSRKR